jgi:hypothetical protein
MVKKVDELSASINDIDLELVENSVQVESYLLFEAASDLNTALMKCACNSTHEKSKQER